MSSQGTARTANRALRHGSHRCPPRCGVIEWFKETCAVAFEPLAPPQVRKRVFEELNAGMTVGKTFNQARAPGLCCAVLRCTCVRLKMCVWNTGPPRRAVLCSAVGGSAPGARAAAPTTTHHATLHHTTHKPDHPPVPPYPLPPAVLLQEERVQLHQFQGALGWPEHACALVPALPCRPVPYVSGGWWDGTPGPASSHVCSQLTSTLRALLANAAHIGVYGMPALDGVGKRMKARLSP